MQQYPITPKCHTCFHMARGKVTKTSSIWPPRSVWRVVWETSGEKHLNRKRIESQVIPTVLSPLKSKSAWQMIQKNSEQNILREKSHFTSNQQENGLIPEVRISCWCLAHSWTVRLAAQVGCTPGAQLAPREGSLFKREDLSVLCGLQHGLFSYVLVLNGLGLV